MDKFLKVIEWIDYEEAPTHAPLPEVKLMLITLRTNIIININ